jgi:hypothetical protein
LLLIGNLKTERQTFLTPAGGFLSTSGEESGFFSDTESIEAGR